MDQTLIYTLVAALTVAIILLIVAVALLFSLRRKTSASAAESAATRAAALEARNAELEMTGRLLRENREEQANSLARFEEAMSRNLASNRETLNAQLTQNRETLDRLLSDNRESVEKQLLQLQEGNEAKLEQMRQTVDEKLTHTVEKRFSESFKLISERLEQVHRGLGEMQKLAGGVDDLKKVLSGVKTRGNLGEYQLGAILEQILSPEQYLTNAAVKPRSQERVEYAVKLPSKDESGAELLLPIDSKFPLEDYERLLAALEGLGGESAAEVPALSARLAKSVRTFAKDIRNKYINPPITTDFAIMFVPTEGLYAEILRTPGLFEELQRDYKVTVVGPTNLAAFLSSLQMGFRTLAIEKRSSEVWQLLGAIKTEFSRFDTLLENVKKKLDAASNEMEKVSSKTRNISRRLGKVQELPSTESVALLESGESDE